MAASDSTLSIADLSVSYGGAYVLTGVGLTVTPGEHLGLVGPSGVGKSTLLGSTVGLVRPDRGSIRLGAINLLRIPLGQRKAVRARLRMIPQVRESQPPTPTTVAQRLNEAFKQARRAGRTTDASVDDALAAMELAPRFADRPLDTLSGGERQRLTLAVALATRPDVLILDEPLTAVDPGQRRELAHRLRERTAGVSVLIATHDTTLLKTLADTIVVLEAGSLSPRLTLEQLTQAPATLYQQDLARSLTERPAPAPTQV